MTAREKVFKVYGNASVTDCAGVWEIWESEAFEGDYAHRIGHSTVSEEAAWQNAVESLPAQPEQERYSPHPSGIAHGCPYDYSNPETERLLLEERGSIPSVQGTFSCPICESAVPHKHTGTEIAESRVAGKKLPPASTNSPAIPAKEGRIGNDYHWCRFCCRVTNHNPKSSSCLNCGTIDQYGEVDNPTKEREQEAVAVRVNDKPPIHWQENDGWKRHPQTAEEWNWHDDHVSEVDRRSELRINFAVDRSDPHAPDQMAQVLRIDLMRITSRMHSAEAYKRLHLSKQDSQPSDQPTQKEAQGLPEYQLEEIWERHCELMEVIECDMRGDKSLMGKRDFYAAAKDVIKAYRRVKDDE